MKLAASVLFILLAADAPNPGPAIPYFSNVRDVHVTQPDRQNYFVVDEELWSGARRDLGDLRLYAGESAVQYALSEQRAGASSEETEAKILNLGSVGGHTEFDLDAAGIIEYDRVRLRLDTHDFVATASVSGGNATGKGATVELPPCTLYDFTKEQLGSNSVLKLPASSFRYLHVRLSAGIRPQQVKGAAIFNLREQQASWTKAGSCGEPQQKQRTTVIACAMPARVPLDRVLFHVAAADVNFRRTVSVEDPSGAQIAAGEISRVRVNRGGTLVINEELAVSVPERNFEEKNADGSRHVTLVIDNGDNPPLAISNAETLSIERRIYFDSQGKTSLRLYYGDDKLAAPVYDYARFFHAEATPAQAELGAGEHNAQYTGRPDDRPWSERHTAVLWGTMLLATAVLAILALRGLRAGRPT
jgi:hypothetical protein